MTGIVRRSAAWLRRRVTKLVRRSRQRRSATYSSAPYSEPNTLFLEPVAFESPYLNDWIDHRFDLLGSGSARVERGMSCKGLEGHRYGPFAAPVIDRDGRWLEGVINPANLSDSQRIWRLVDPDYAPIDWQIDFKSGYRWSESTWAGDICLGHVPGADIKVPWELARLQHLPEMALSYALTHSDATLREFRNQVFDFIATNPPSFGVNWACTMDVAIRAANLVVAFDLFREAGSSFDQQFLNAFQNSIRDHVRHITSNFERYGDIRGNHYLANVAGLLFAAAWLPANDWFEWAARELVSEVAHQFNEDGSNFEGSTAYHRLASDMVFSATALLRERGKTFPEWYETRLMQMKAFVRDTTKPDTTLHQVGDNDSGRFFNVMLSGGEGDAINSPIIGSESELGIPPFRYVRTQTFDGPGAEPLQWRAYPDFGLYIIRSSTLYAAIICRGAGRRGPTGHLHNDQLALELFMGGVNLIRDRGSYVYTPLPEMRNRYRSVRAHFTPWPFDREPASLDAGLFNLPNEPAAIVRYHGPAGFVGEMMVDGVRIRRQVIVNANQVSVTDMCDHPFECRRDDLPFSSGYGIVEKTAA